MRTNKIECLIIFFEIYEGNESKPFNHSFDNLHDTFELVFWYLPTAVCSFFEISTVKLLVKSSSVSQNISKNKRKAAYKYSIILVRLVAPT